MHPPVDDGSPDYYWRILFPGFSGSTSPELVTGRLKTSAMSLGLWHERETLRNERRLSPDSSTEHAHPTALVTYEDSPVWTMSVRACLGCRWVSSDVDAEHPDVVPDPMSSSYPPPRGPNPATDVPGTDPKTRPTGMLTAGQYYQRRGLMESGED